MSATTTIHLGAFAQKSVPAAGFDVTYYEAGVGTPLVVLPGAGGPSLGPAYDALAQQFRVIMIELPGWGAASNDVADFDGLADQVVAAIDAIGLTTFHLLGTSFGGACSLHLATRHPTRVISLTLESPAKLRVDSINPGELPPEKFVQAFRTHPERGLPMTPPDPAFMGRVWPTVMRLMGDGLLDDTFADRLRALQTRTLVMFGKDDGVINPINGRTYRQLMPNCVLMYVYDASHEIAQDRPEAFVDVVSDFVRRGMNFIVNDADRLINP
jgi:pimeloyl-ACP methyl ester carboxylesterase